jgi:hypothetical protein
LECKKRFLAAGGKGSAYPPALRRSHRRAWLGRRALRIRQHHFRLPCDGTATSVARVEQSAAPFALVARVRRQPAGTAPRSGSAAKFRPASRRPHDPRQARHRARRRGCGVAVCSADESGAYPARRFPRRAERPRVARLAPWGPRWTSNPSGFRGQVALSQLRHEVSVSTPYACGPRLATRFAGPSKRRRLGRRGLGGDGGGDGAGD